MQRSPLGLKPNSIARLFNCSISCLFFFHLPRCLIVVPSNTATLPSILRRILYCACCFRSEQTAEPTPSKPQQDSPSTPIYPRADTSKPTASSPLLQDRSHIKSYRAVDTTDPPPDTQHTIMAPSIMSPVAPSTDGIFRQKRTSSSRQVSGAHDGDSVISGAARTLQSRVTSRKFSSMGTTNISSVVASLQRRSGDELGSSASSRLLTATYHTIWEWIRSERMSLLPPEGSDYDKVLAWAQLFVDRLHSFDEEIERFAGDSYLAAQMSYGYCSMLLEVSSCPKITKPIFNHNV